MLVTLGTFNDGKLTLEKKLLSNDKITASWCPTNIPQAVWSNVINNKNELWKTVRLTRFQKPTISIRCNILQVWPSVPSFVFTMLFIPS